VDIPGPLHHFPLPVSGPGGKWDVSFQTCRMISHFLFTLAQTTVPPAGPAGFFSSPIVPIILFGVILYFMVFRPQSQRQKALEALISSLKTGDKVVTTGGIHGIISNVKEGKTLILKIADNVKVEIDKTAIAGVDKAPEPAAAATPAITAS
jgi:preprotein translocase subunit YajC